MTTTASRTHDDHPPLRLAVGAGVTTACSVGGLALVGAGQGITGWALMMLGVGVTVAVQLSLRTTDDVRRRGTRLGRVGVMVALLSAVLAGGLAARAAVATPWLAATIALASGVAAAALLRGWQRQDVTEDR